MQGMLYVYEVYREKSFSRAARKLFVSQPALSAAVKKAETTLGVLLFDRSSSPLQLTAAGKAYIEATQQIMAIEKKLLDYCHDLENLNSGSLAVGGTNFFASCLLPPIIREFSNAYPNIQLQITESDSAELYERLLTEDLDLIVDSGIYNETLYESIPLLEDHILLGVPAQYPVNDKFSSSRLTQADIIRGQHHRSDILPLPLTCFAGEEFLLLGKGNDMHRRALDLCRRSGFTPKVRLYLNQLMTAYHTACQGLGITFLTDSLIKMSMPSEALFYYKIRDDAATRKIFIAAKKNCYRTHAMQEFIQLGQALYQDDTLPCT